MNHFHTKYNQNDKQIQVQRAIEEQLKKNIKLYINHNNKHKITMETQITSIRLNFKWKRSLNQQQLESIYIFNKFIFKLLNHGYTPLKQCDNEVNKQQRFYLIAPLQSWYEYDIDFQSILRINEGCNETLNGTKWKTKFRSSLKNKIVQIEKNEGEKQLCISYGIYQNINIDEKENNVDEDPDEDDTKSVLSFASESVVDGFNKLGLKIIEKNKQKRIVLIRNIDPQNPQKLKDTTNPLNIENISQSGDQFKETLGYALLDNVYPTGIPTQMWYILKLIPAILWMIEGWLNAISLKRDIIRKLAIDLQNDILDTTLLFQALHRSKTSSNNSYQITNTLGAYCLKSLLTINKFSNNAKAELHTIRDHVEAGMDKKLDNNRPLQYRKLVHAAKKWNIMSYAMVKDFKFEKWNPPGFECRKEDSLYVIETEHQRLKGHHRNRIYRDLGAHLIQSIVGVFYYSFMNNSDVDKTKVFSNSMIATFRLLHCLGIISQKFCIDHLFQFIPNKHMLDEKVMQLKEIAIVDGLNDSLILNASLWTVCHTPSKLHFEYHPDESDKLLLFKDYGITLDRFAALGDALLDMLVVWQMCYSIGYQIFIPQIGEKIKTNWREEITNERHAWVNDEKLAASAAVIHEYIAWFDKFERKSVQHFVNDVYNKIKYISKKTKGECDNQSVITDSSMLKDVTDERETPRGNTREKYNRIEVKVAKKCLGTIFEALLGAIFISANDEIYCKGLPLEKMEFNLVPCIQYLISFLGNHSAWKKTMEPYIDNQM